MIADWRARAEIAFGKAWRWWIGALAGSVPRALRQRFAGGRGQLLLLVDAPGDNLIEETGEGRRPLGRIDVEAPDARQIAAPRAAQREHLPVAIRLEAQHTLRTTTSLPLAAERNLAQVIGFEFERLVPFKQSEVHFAYRITARDKAAQTLAVELTIVPHTAVAKAVAALHGLGFEAAEIQVPGPSGEAATVIPLARGNRIASGRGSRRINRGLGVIAVSLAIGCAGLPLWRDSATIARLDAQIAAARQQADSSANLQRLIDAARRDQQFLGDHKRASPTVTEILATLTRLIPDDAYLTELTIAGDRLRIIGAANSATALLALLDQSPAFRDVAFRSPVIRDARLNLERFDITAQIVQRGAP
ncbi:MAG TPA: PilN domain-containing protein [Stellaceae bacterium]|nr:PilN domain-containing protein [Stellaceae bacterium]